MQSSRALVDRSKSPLNAYDAEQQRIEEQKQAIKAATHHKLYPPPKEVPDRVAQNLNTHQTETERSILSNGMNHSAAGGNKISNTQPASFGHEQMQAVISENVQ